MNPLKYRLYVMWAAIKASARMLAAAWRHSGEMTMGSTLVYEIRLESE